MFFSNVLKLGLRMWSGGRLLFSLLQSGEMEELEGWEKALKGIAPGLMVNQVNHVAAFFLHRTLWRSSTPRSKIFMPLRYLQGVPIPWTTTVTWSKILVRKSGIEYRYDFSTNIDSWYMFLHLMVVCFLSLAGYWGGKSWKIGIGIPEVWLWTRLACGPWSPSSSKSLFGQLHLGDSTIFHFFCFMRLYLLLAFCLYLSVFQKVGCLFCGFLCGTNWHPHSELVWNLST